ncbi:MAG: LCP family protein, partial [Clostridia bacterium]|nr:LCP family protein [Clostridia bacterium]
MEKSKKTGINTKLLVLIIALIIILGAVIYALSFYGDISDPESLFDEPIPTPPPAADSTPAPTAEPTPTPDPDKVLSAQSDEEFMSKRTNILVLGIDESAEREDWGSFRTDTILLVSVDFSDNDVCMVSIPRDSYVKLYTANGNLVDETNPYDKINSAFSEGGGAQKKGFEYTMTTIEQLMGINVDYYCAFNMNVVKDVVNAMGGVDYEVDVEVSMNGRTLSPGFQHLDGQG